jgi:signal transduction histidine kinase
MRTYGIPKAARAHSASAEVGLIVSAIPVPLLVADYAPIIDRFSNMDPKGIRARLTEDEDLLRECLRLPRIVSASPGWTRLYGSPTAADTPDLIERRFSAAAYPDLRESMIRQFTAPFTGTTSIIREHVTPTMEGPVTVRSHWQATIIDGEPNYSRVVIVDLDITDLRAAQRYLEDSLHAKERLIRSKNDLIASVSHEIRTPLSAIVGYARLLHESPDLADADRTEMVNILVEQSADLTNIVDDLLIAARASRDRFEVARVGVDMRAQVAQVLETMCSANRKVTLRGVPVRCTGDPQRVRQIIRNLISNAVRYGGPEIFVEVGSRGEMGCLTVADNGPEIPAEISDRIFEAYERGDDSPGQAQALGLGLFISRTLAVLMDGELNYHYEDGRSSFTLTLPLLSFRPEPTARSGVAPSGYGTKARSNGMPDPVKPRQGC